MYNTNESYLSHKNEIVLIRSKKETTVELINPKYKKYFDKPKQDKNDNIFIKYDLDKKHYNDVKSIEVIIREYNVLFVPRHWIFKFGVINNHIEVVLNENDIGSYLT